MTNAHFMPGREVSEQLAHLIEPRLRAMFPRLPLGLAVIGPGSDVLQYDTARSMDHDWGPRLTIVIPDDLVTEDSASIDAAIDSILPAKIAGFPTRFSLHADGTTFPDAIGPVHHLHVTSTRQVISNGLMIHNIGDLSDAVWLSTPMQSLLEITAGAVFVDDTGELTRLRAQLAFYPGHILRYQLAALWMRVSQIQPFIGRSGEVGDEAGSATIAASIVRDLMRIGLLQSGRYAPYAKWIGTAFARTEIGAAVLPDLTATLHAQAWQEREAGINRAGLQLVRQLNGLRHVTTVPGVTAQFHTRPFQVLPAEDIAHKMQASLGSTSLARLTPFLGGIDVLTDSTDTLKSGEFRLALRTMFTRSAVDLPD